MFKKTTGHSCMGMFLVMLVVACVSSSVRAEVSARSYVQNGLISQRDGITIVIR